MGQEKCVRATRRGRSRWHTGAGVQSGGCRGWHLGASASDTVAIDPVLGRLAFPTNQAPPGTVQVTFHDGFSADMGGGEYERAASFDALLQPVRQVSAPDTIQPL